MWQQREILTLLEVTEERGCGEDAITEPTKHPFYYFQQQAKGKLQVVYPNSVLIYPFFPLFHAHMH